MISAIPTPAGRRPTIALHIRVRRREENHRTVIRYRIMSTPRPPAALAKDRAALTQQAAALRARLHAHTRQTPLASRPFIQRFTTSIQPRQHLFRAFAQQRQFMIRAFPDHNTQIFRTTLQPQKIIAPDRRPSNRIRATRRTYQIVIPFIGIPQVIRHPDHREIHRVEHQTLDRLHTQPRRRNGLKRPAIFPPRKHIRTLTRRRKRTKPRIRPQQKMIAIFRRITKLKTHFPANRHAPEHILRVTLISRRHQLIPTTIRQQFRTPRQSRKHPFPTRRNTKPIHRDQPKAIHRTRRQTTSLHTHIHKPITRTNTHRHRRHHTTTTTILSSIFKLVSRTSTQRVDLTAQIRKRRRHTTRRHTTNRRRNTRRRERLHFTFRHPTLFTSTRFINQPITINFPSHQTLHFNTHTIILFPRPFPHQPPLRRRPRHTPHPTRTRKTTHPKHLFRHNLKKTFTKFKIPTTIILRTPHNTTQNHPANTQTPNPTRHRARIKPTPTKHIHHTPPKFTTHSPPMNTHIQNTTHTHHKTTIIIETFFKQNLTHPTNPPQIHTRHRKLINTPTRTGSHQHITIRRIHRNILQATPEQGRYRTVFIDFLFPRYRLDKTPFRGELINLRYTKNIIIDDINIARRPLKTRNSNTLNTFSYPFFDWPPIFTRPPDQFTHPIDITLFHTRFTRKRRRHTTDGFLPPHPPSFSGIRIVGEIYVTRIRPRRIIDCDPGILASTEKFIGRIVKRQTADMQTSQRRHRRRRRIPRKLPNEHVRRIEFIHHFSTTRSKRPHPNITTIRPAIACRDTPHRLTSR